MMRDSFRSFCKEKLMPRVLLAHRNEGKKKVVISNKVVSSCTAAVAK
jgi:hypothetical protein